MIFVIWCAKLNLLKCWVPFIFFLGYFSCVASDGYSEKHQSTYVIVQTTPQIYIPKRQMVLPANASVRIPCFSINEPYNSFQYEWYENEAKIQWHTHNRFVESLLPSGTQLFAKRISQSTNFTCRVANMVGAVNLTSRVFVAKGNQTMGIVFFVGKKYNDDT